VTHGKQGHTLPGNDKIRGGAGTRYIANAGLEQHGEQDLILLDRLDWPTVDVVQEEDSFKKLIPVIVLLLVVIVLAFFRLKPKQGS